MSVYLKPTSLDLKTYKPLNNPEHDQAARCLAVLVAAATALTNLHGAIMQAEPAELVILDLMLSLNNICDGDGVQLRADTEAIATRLGCKLIATDTPLPADMN